jgi:hypothetical protein
VQPLVLVVFGLALAAGFAVVAERVACRSPKSLRAVPLGGVATLLAVVMSKRAPLDQRSAPPPGAR